MGLTAAVPLCTIRIIMKVVIEYKGLIGMRRRGVDIPERWGALSERQYRAVVQWWMSCESGGASMYRAVSRLLESLLGLPMNVVGRLGEYQVWALMERLSWLRDIMMPHNDFFVKQLGALCAPLPKLKGVTLQKYMTVDTFYQLAALHPDAEKRLDMFIASLYNKPGEVFSEVNIDANMRELKKVSRLEKMMVFMNFALIRSWLSRSFPWLFPSGDGEGEAHGEKRTVTPWLEIFDAFVGDDVSNMEKYRTMECMDAFRVMNRRLKMRAKAKP